MARVNVYLPDELAAEARRSELNVSSLTQEAIRHALAVEGTNHWLDRVTALDATNVSHESALRALGAARDELGI
jgi:post-segregation antitoxin (ccd killing protein)